MDDLLALIGQIFIITCVQSILEVLIDAGERPQLSKILNVACYAGGLYLVLQFVFKNLMSELFTLFRFG